MLTKFGVRAFGVVCIHESKDGARGVTGRGWYKTRVDIVIHDNVVRNNAPSPCGGFGGQAGGAHVLIVLR